MKGFILDVTMHHYQGKCLSVHPSVRPSIGWLVGQSVGWLVGRLVSWSVGWSVGQLVGWSVGW